MGYVALGITGLFLYVIEYIRKRRRGLPTNAIELYNYTVESYSEADIIALRRMPYKKYLETDHWELLRDAVFKYYGKKCFDCGISHWWKHMEAHHITYKNRGHEKIEDLIPLCRSCHAKRHGK